MTDPLPSRWLNALVAFHAALLLAAGITVGAAYVVNYQTRSGVTAAQKINQCDAEVADAR